MMERFWIGPSSDASHTELLLGIWDSCGDRLLWRQRCFHAIFWEGLAGSALLLFYANGHAIEHALDVLLLTALASGGMRSCPTVVLDRVLQLRTPFLRIRWMSTRPAQKVDQLRCR